MTELHPEERRLMEAAFRRRLARVVKMADINGTGLMAPSGVMAMMLGQVIRTGLHLFGEALIAECAEGYLKMSRHTNGLCDMCGVPLLDLTDDICRKCDQELETLFRDELGEDEDKGGYGHGV